MAHASGFMQNTTQPADPDAELLLLCKLFQEQRAIVDVYLDGILRDPVMIDGALSALGQLAATIEQMRPVTRAGDDAKAAVLSQLDLARSRTSTQRFARKEPPPAPAQHRLERPLSERAVIIGVEPAQIPEPVRDRDRFH